MPSVKDKSVQIRDNECGKLRVFITRLGLCSKCKEQIIHDLDQPFASCGCGTMEWISEPPILQTTLSVSREHLIQLFKDVME